MSSGLILRRVLFVVLITTKQVELNETFTKSNVDNVSVRTDQDYVKALMNLFAKRN